ncbi:Remodeling and spacing factor 1 [Tetrabaena socialis]|uniref:Remodeling and spacing factor 1 n=1 Tax=Tetrabaena socialis TaxID=47790 RepID=A0A2J7ZY09_9CHLO|nr:Remodeling and spacing factor 1 [Tetrabaena socialis]|eukprot:PNH05142.1 Remodeling and spacing factor 1 [Tetrabaena socialis]
MTAHVTHCAPCHLPIDGHDIDPRLARPSPSHPCEACGFPDGEEWMLLCLGWHTYCLQPPLTSIPDGTWVCPHCAQKGISASSIEARLRRNGRSNRHLGVAAYSGLKGRSHLFTVSYDDGTAESLSVPQLRSRITTIATKPCILPAPWSTLGLSPRCSTGCLVSTTRSSYMLSPQLFAPTTSGEAVSVQPKLQPSLLAWTSVPRVRSSCRGTGGGMLQLYFAVRAVWYGPELPALVCNRLFTKASRKPLPLEYAWMRSVQVLRMRSLISSCPLRCPGRVSPPLFVFRLVIFVVQIGRG